MTLIEWQDSFSVGVEKLDADHKRLFDIINRVDAAEKAADYPEIEEHMRQHKAFVEWLATVERTYNLAPDAHFHIAESVNEYLRDWWTHHILLVDMQYKGRLS